MTALAVVSAIALIATLVAAVVARVRFWGARLRAAVPAARKPEGAIVLASASERGRHAELVPVLADWVVRDVVSVEKLGASLAASPADSTSSGPVWRFTAGAAVTAVDPVEVLILEAMFGRLPATGDSVVVERDDVAWRERVSTAIVHAVRAQRAAFGAERPRHAWLRPVLVLLTLLATLGLLVGAFLSLGNPAALAWLSVGAPLVMLVTVLVTVWPAKSAAERRYLQAVRDLGAWVRTTENPAPELCGWAMIWNLPGPWAAAAPPDVAGLVRMDRAFLRGDFASTVPDTFSLG
jgi:hypothetical protein